MSEISISLGDAFAEAFGYRTSAFEPEFTKVPSGSSIDPAVPRRKEYGTAASAPLYGKDIFGREYYLPVTMKYTTSTPTGVGTDTVDIAESWDLPYPVISVRCKKTIVETPLTERRGTVKELINIMDYDITIRGLIVGKTNEFPEEAVTKLRSLFEQNTAIEMHNGITDIFLMRKDRSGSDMVVIKDLSFPEVKGIKNVRPYELVLVSDEAFSLEEI